MSKPIALFITDTHLYERRAKFDEIESDNIELNKSLYKQAILIAKEKGLDTIYHGGDIFHSRKSQSLNILNTFKEILSMFKESDIRLVAISGNHDKTDYSAKESFIFPFQHHPNFKLVEISGEEQLTKNISLHLLPFYESEQYTIILKDHVKGLDKNKTNILLTHTDIKGAINNSGIVLDHGHEHKLFNKFDKVLSGHIHDRSELDKGRIVYIGAAYQHNFGEGENKGVALLYDDLSIEYVDLEFPKYKNISIDVDSLSKKDIDSIIKEQVSSSDYYKVKITGSKEKLKSKSDSIASLVDAGIKVTFNDNESVIINNENNVSMKVFTNDTIFDAFKEFCEEKGHDFEKSKTYLEKI